MGTLVPQQAAVLLAALLAVSLGATTAWTKAEAAAPPPPVVVGSIKCLDCFPNDVNSGDAFKGTCKSPACTAYLHFWFSYVATMKIWPG